MTLFVKVDQSNFICLRPTRDNILLVHQHKQLRRALVCACVFVRARMCMRACVRACVRVRALCARGSMEIMVTTATSMRGVLRKEAIS